MLKNVPSDKMDDPSVDAVGKNTLFCKAELTRKAKKMFSVWVFLLFEKLAIAAEKQPCVYFQHRSVLGDARALQTVYP